MIYKAKVVSHRLLTDHILFKLLIDKDGQPTEVFSKSYITASTSEKTDTVLGMTRKRLALMGLDMDTCTDDEWDAFMKIETLLGGKEVDVDEKENPPYGVQYDILTNQVADEARAVQIRDALRGVKGRPRGAAPAAPAAPRPTMAAPARPAAPRPLAAPAQTPARTPSPI
jgi:hypothetical protein